MLKVLQIFFADDIVRDTTWTWCTVCETSSYIMHFNLRILKFYNGRKMDGIQNYIFSGGEVQE